MSREPARPPRVASRRLTSATLTGGVLVGAASILVAVIGEMLGSTAGPEQVTSIAGLTAGLMALEPSAWASLGVYAIVATPALGLVVSAVEYAQAGDRGTAGLALVVLAFLALGGIVAVLR